MPDVSVQGQVQGQGDLAVVTRAEAWRRYHQRMVSTGGGVTMETFAELARSAGLRCVRVPDTSAPVQGVVIHAVGDPIPDAGSVALCPMDLGGADRGEGELSQCAGAVLRESSLAEALLELPPDLALFTTSEAVRWSDVYDQLQAGLAELSGSQVVNDAFHLADTLAISLGGAVTIEDVDRRVIAFSAVPGHWIDDVRRQGILGRKVPEHLERDEWYARLWRATGVVEFHAGVESTARVAIAVRVAGQPVGSVWVVGSRDALSPETESILETATTVVAASLAGQDQSAARSRGSRARTLGHLLNGSGADQVGSFAFSGPTVLVAAVRSEGHEDPELLDARLADVLSMQAQRFQGAGLAAPIGGTVYALLPWMERSQFDSQLRSTLYRAGLSHGQVAVSGVLSDVQAVAQARLQADRLLRLHEGSELTDVGLRHVDDDLSALWLAEVEDAIRGVEAMTSGVVKEVARHDEKHGTDYVVSLRAWFEACNDIPAAAAKVHVHPNTFRYRLARASEIFGLQMDDPDQRLLLQLQLRLGDAQ